jgi:malate synthase
VIGRRRRPKGTGTNVTWNKDRETYEVRITLPDGRRTTLRDGDKAQLERRRDALVQKHQASYAAQRALKWKTAFAVADDEAIAALRADLHELVDALLDAALSWQIEKLCPRTVSKDGKSED